MATQTKTTSRRGGGGGRRGTTPRMTRNRLAAETAPAMPRARGANTKTAQATGSTRVTARLAQRARGIERRRKKLGMSRLTLAHRAGCSPTMVLNFERGEMPQTSEALPRVLAVLDEAEQG